MNHDSSFFDNLVIKKLIEDKDYFVKVYPHVKEKYFRDRDESKEVVRCIIEHSRKYKTPPSYDEISVMLSTDSSVRDKEKTLGFLKNDVRGLEFESTTLNFLFDATETHFQLKELTEAIMTGAEIVQDPKQLMDRQKLLPLFREALSVALDRRNGLNYFSDEAISKQHDHYVTPERRIKLREWPVYNRATAGGTYRQSLNMLIAMPGVGKTQFLVNVGRQYLEDGLNVLYVTLEISEIQIAERFDASMLKRKTSEFPNILKEDYIAARKELRSKVKGQLIVRAYPAAKATCTTIQLLMDDLKNSDGFTPDIVIVDYIGLLRSDRIKFSDNLYSYKGSIAEEIRGLATENNVVVWTASQTNRAAYQNQGDFDLDVVAESSVFTHTSDHMLALYETKDLTAMGRVEIKQLKSRLRDKNYISRWPLLVDKDMQTFVEVPQEVLERERKENQQKREAKSPVVPVNRELTRSFIKQEKEYVIVKPPTVDIVLPIDKSEQNDFDAAGKIFGSKETPDAQP